MTVPRRVVTRLAVVYRVLPTQRCQAVVWASLAAGRAAVEALLATVGQLSLVAAFASATRGGLM